MKKIKIQSDPVGSVIILISFCWIIVVFILVSVLVNSSTLYLSILCYCLLLLITICFIGFIISIEKEYASQLALSDKELIIFYKKLMVVSRVERVNLSDILSFHVDCHVSDKGILYDPFESDKKRSMGEIEKVENLFSGINWGLADRNNVFKKSEDIRQNLCYILKILEGIDLKNQELDLFYLKMTVRDLTRDMTYCLVKPENPADFDFRKEVREINHMLKQLELKIDRQTNNKLPWFAYFILSITKVDIIMAERTISFKSYCSDSFGFGASYSFMLKLLDISKFIPNFSYKLSGDNKNAIADVIYYAKFGKKRPFNLLSSKEKSLYIFVCCVGSVIVFSFLYLFYMTFFGRI